MSGTWLDEYIEAWCDHRIAGGPAGAAQLDRLTRLMTPDVRYEDVPTAGVYIGADGLAAMSQLAYQMSSDMAFDVVSSMASGDQFAFENVTTGTHTGDVGPVKATRKRFTLRAASLGTVTEDGLVAAHRDYWDLAGFLIQIGVMEPPA